MKKKNVETFLSQEAPFTKSIKARVGAAREQLGWMLLPTELLGKRGICSAAESVSAEPKGCPLPSGMGRVPPAVWGKSPPFLGAWDLREGVMQLELSFSFSVFASPWIAFIGFSQKLPVGLEMLGSEGCAGLFCFLNQHQTFLDETI